MYETIQYPLRLASLTISMSLLNPFLKSRLCRCERFNSATLPGFIWNRWFLLSIGTPFETSLRVSLLSAVEVSPLCTTTVLPACTPRTVAVLSSASSLNWRSSLLTCALLFIMFPRIRRFMVGDKILDLSRSLSNGLAFCSTVRPAENGLTNNKLLNIS